jgi:predicted metal-dependent HD superfamily phosphohydrolase
MDFFKNRRLTPSDFSSPEAFIQQALVAYGSAAGMAVFEELRAAYAPRPYHNWQHLQHLARMLEVLIAGELDEKFIPRDPRWTQEVDGDWEAVLWALLGHDVIMHEPGKNPVELSANWTQARVLSLTGHSEMAQESARLIRLTDYGAKPPPLSLRDALFVDADMAILGAPAPLYDAYARGILAEYESYGHTPDAVRSGRIAFLRTLNPSTLFHTRTARWYFTEPATVNIARELAFLNAA